MRLPSQRYDWLLLLLLGALFFVPGLGNVHLFDWDEINFAECAREMIASGNYLQVQINFEPFYEKPPLYFWMQATSMQVFGINEFAARFPNALGGIISLVLLYGIGRRWQGRRFGWLWVLLYLGSILPHLYFKSGIIDPWFNLFIFLALVVWIHAGRTHWRRALLGGVLLGLAILTKGPVAALILGLVILVKWVSDRFRRLPSIWNILAFAFTALLIPALWFGLEYLTNGPDFLREFFLYQIRLLSTEDAGHGGFPGYHAVVLLLGCFPASVFALRALFRSPEKQKGEQARWLRILFWTVLILFSLVQSKIVHYSSLCYFPLTYLAAVQLQYWWKNKQNIPTAERILTGFIGGIWVIGSLALPVLGRQPELLQQWASADPFARANLEAAVQWPWIALLPGIWLLLWLVFFLLDKKRLARLPFYLLGSALFVSLALGFFVKRIEGYSQRALITFYEEHREERAYFQPMGFKSYAHLWYARVPADLPEASKEKSWLLEGPIDRPVYFTTKVHKADQLAKYPDLERIGERNGFVFFLRRPQ